MTRLTSTTLLALTLIGSTMNAAAVDMANIVKAQVLLGQVTQVVEKYQEVQAMLDAGTLELDVKEPMTGATGKFVLPFDEAGNLTAWAEKSLTAQAGAEVGKQVGNKAAGMLAAKVPFGGFMGGAAKSKAKEMGAVTAIGGWDFIKENSTMSFTRSESWLKRTASKNKASGMSSGISPAANALDGNVTP